MEPCIGDQIDFWLEQLRRGQTRYEIRVRGVSKKGNLKVEFLIDRTYYDCGYNSHGTRVLKGFDAIVRDGEIVHLDEWDGSYGF